MDGERLRNEGRRRRRKKEGEEREGKGVWRAKEMTKGKLVGHIEKKGKGKGSEKKNWD